MKLCLFLVAGAALAAQDHTPPTISLTLPSTAREIAEPSNQVSAPAQHTCEVGDDATACPLPTCQAFDHHDLHCNEAGCDSLTGVALEQYCHQPSGGHGIVSTMSNAGTANQVIRNASVGTRCTHQFSCDRTILLINNDNTANAADGTAASCGNAASAGCASVNRALRSMWEFRYDATDRAGQVADTVSFSLIVRDTQAPSLQTEFGAADDATWLVRSTKASDVGGADEARFEAEACNMPTNYASNNDAACTWTLPQDQSVVNATDNYDSDVTHRIWFKLARPDGSWAHGADTTLTNSNGATDTESPDGVHLSTEWNGEPLYECPGGQTCSDYSFADWTIKHASIAIDTTQVGVWSLYYQTCDVALEFGADSDNNCRYQTVTIEVTDNTPPEVETHPGQTGTAPYVPNTGRGGGEGDTSGSGAEDVLECGVDVYNERGAMCWDLLDSWTASPTSPYTNCKATTGSATWCPSAATVGYADAGAARSAVAALHTDEAIGSRSAVGGLTNDATTTYTVHYDCTDALGHKGYGGSNTQYAAKDDTRLSDGADGDWTGPAHGECTDNNSATTCHGAYRIVTVRDTRPPTLTLLGDLTIENSAGIIHGDQNAGERETDAHNCASNTDQTSCEAVTESATSPIQHTATNVCVWDASSSTCAPHVWEDANHGLRVSYIEGQATCSDECDTDPHIMKQLFYGLHCNGTMVGNGDPSNFPEYRKGEYSIKYTCFDGTSDSNSTESRVRLTDTACRHILNVDQTRPVIIPLGSDHMTLEASHTGNYIDDGATCSDQVDGVISQNVEVSGEVVNLAVPGEYRVEYNCKDSSTRCNAAGNPDPQGPGGFPCRAHPAFRTVYVRRTQCPTCYLRDCDHRYTNTPEAWQHDLVPDHDPLGSDAPWDACGTHTTQAACDAAVPAGGTDATDKVCRWQNHTGTYACHAYSLNYCRTYHEASFSYTDPGVVCHDAYEGELAPSMINTTGTVDPETVGNYTITYRACNEFGLCSDGSCRGRNNRYVRTVEVVDTLRPVIRLHYNGTEVAKGDGSDTGVHGQTNSVMMAERSAPSGAWAMAAASAAVAGLALLAHGRRTEAVLSVPV